MAISELKGMQYSGSPGRDGRVARFIRGIVDAILRPKHALDAVHVHHAALTVSDMRKSIDFYSNILGFKVDTNITVNGGLLQIVHLVKNGTFLELFFSPDPAPLPDHARTHEKDIKVVGTKHVSFGTDRPQVLHEWLREHGVDGLTDIHEGDDYYYFFLKDPDGITLEIVSRKESPVSPMMI